MCDHSTPESQSDFFAAREEVLHLGPTHETQRSHFRQVLDNEIFKERLRQRFSFERPSWLPPGQPTQASDRVLDSYDAVKALVKLMAQFLTWSGSRFRVGLDFGKKEKGDIRPPIINLVVRDSNRAVLVPLSVRTTVVEVDGTPVYLGDQRPCMVENGPENLALAFIAAAEKAADKL